jgi:hypothetical protein
VPHAPALPQLTVQSTPRLLVSLATVAASAACAPSVVDAEGALEIVTTIGVAVTILTVAVADMAELVVDLAVMVTAPPVGTDEGAI